MIKVYYCEQCDITFYLSTEIDTTCRSCGSVCTKIRTSYPEFTDLNLEGRANLIKLEMEKEKKRRLRREKIQKSKNDDMMELLEDA